MVFGLGRKKQNAQSDGAADNAATGAPSLSGEAMDMVREAASSMSAGGMSAGGSAMAPAMAPTMAPTMATGAAASPVSVVPDSADAGQTRRRIRRVYINHGDSFFIYKLVIFYVIRVAIIHVHRCGLYCGARHRGLGWGA
ncbi:MAG: hypothetical protein ISQ31_09860 [Alphaproteobacteria bacterium]|nr:hypothetical protein [Alphaproteobacteria bacterium]